MVAKFVTLQVTVRNLLLQTVTLLLQVLQRCYNCNNLTIKPVTAFVTV